MNRILIAIDESQGAMKAVEYAARYFSRAGDLQILLVHVLPNLPAIFWDDGHILNEEEKKERKKVVDKWLADRIAKLEPVFLQATEALTAQGAPRAAIGRKTISDSLDTAESLLEAAEESAADTIVLGRRGNPEEKRILPGSVAGKVISQGTGLTIIAVA